MDVINDVSRLLIGLQLLSCSGAEEVVIENKVVYIDAVVEDEYLPIMEILGWDYDEDRSQWFFVC